MRHPGYLSITCRMTHKLQDSVATVFRYSRIMGCLTRRIWKMLGPFATTSRLTPIQQMSLAVLSRAACASMSTTTTTTTTHDRGDRYGPMEWAQWWLCHSFSAEPQRQHLTKLRQQCTMHLLDSLTSWSRHHLWIVQTTAEGTSFSACIMSMVLSDFWVVVDKSFTYLLIYLPWWTEQWSVFRATCCHIASHVALMSVSQSVMLVDCDHIVQWKVEWAQDRSDRLVSWLSACGSRPGSYQQIIIIPWGMK